MEYLKIKYRDKEYNLEELMRESKSILDELVLPEIFDVDFTVVEFGFINDIGYSIAGEKYHDLLSVLRSARFALYNAHLKIHKGEVDWGLGYYSQLWIRGEFLKNAITWYNSCEDYLLQIIWFAFDLFKDLSDLECYKKEMSMCHYNKILKELGNINDNIFSEDLINRIKRFHESPNQKRIRILANSIKHKQLIRIKDVDENRNVFFNRPGFSTKNIEKECIDIDQEIQILIELHKEIVNFGIYLIDLISFNNMFVCDEDGAIIFGEIKARSEYKKIIINNLKTPKYDTE